VGARILTDPMSSRVNIILVPGIRDGALTNYVQSRLSNYSKAFYVMDLATYDADSVRLFDDSSKAPSVQATSEQFDGRALDNNYTATYFPDVTIEDPINNRPVKVPSSIAVIGALSYNDNVAYPWFAPAGFNRASLDFVTNVKVRLNQADRNMLYDSRINPIATFPQAGFVIFGQKTLQFSKSALDRVNVRRMLLEVKRLIVDVANKIVFEQNTPETRARFVGQVTPLLATIQSQQGIDQFKVVMDASNNTQEDIENNVLNGRIVLVPTRAVEFIAMDFIITNAGVSFE
jgi:phage tail sheath protein FI